MMKRLAPLLLILCALFALGVSEAQAQIQAPVFVEVCLNKDIFYVGDYMYVYLNVGNNGLDVLVDAYMSITKPDGTELFAPSYGPLATPYRAGFHLPGGWSSGWMFLEWAQLPSMSLPLIEPGEYTLSFWLCAAGGADILTPKSTQTFQVVPCEMDSWVNDNYTHDVEAGENGIWVALRSGVQYIPYDGSRRITWGRENGPWTEFTQLFRGVAGSVIASGFWPGFSIYDSCGWHSVLNSPAAGETIDGIDAIVADDQNRTWILWGGHGFLHPRTLTCLTADGNLLDYTTEIDGKVLDLCLTYDGRACAVSDKGLHIMYDGSFQFIDMELEFEINSAWHAHGDANGNIWLRISPDGVETHLIRYDLTVNEAFVMELPPTIFSNESIRDITSDSDGNVWFSTSVRLLKYDGDALDSVSRNRCSDIAIGDDGTVYGSTYDTGIQAYTDGEWVSYENGSPDVSGSDYAHAIGLADGQAIIADGAEYGTTSRYEHFNGQVWDEGSLQHDVHSVYQGKTGLWAWDDLSAYREENGTWMDASDGLDGNIIDGIQEDGSGQAYLLTYESLMVFQNNRWELLDTQPDGGYRIGFRIGHSGRICLLDAPGDISRMQIRDEEGNWSANDLDNLLPSWARCFGVSEAGLLYACGYDTDRWFMAVIENGNADVFWLDDMGHDVGWVDFITFDLADRVWLSAIDTDGVPRMLIYDPATGLIHELEDPACRIIPQVYSDNSLYFNTMFDRSFAKYGTLWYTGYGPTRLNLAPQSRIMIDRPLYGCGEPEQVQIHFTNYAGSIAVDWYAALDLQNGSRYYWLPNFETGESSWTSVETPALENIMVPTDTSFIYDYGEFIIPEYAPAGHYWWRSGFKRAGDDEWLGIGFPSYAEFCVIRPPTP